MIKISDYELFMSWNLDQKRLPRERGGVGMDRRILVVLVVVFLAVVVVGGWYFSKNTPYYIQLEYDLEYDWGFPQRGHNTTDYPGFVFKKGWGTTW